MLGHTWRGNTYGNGTYIESKYIWSRGIYGLETHTEWGQIEKGHKWSVDK